MLYKPGFPELNEINNKETVEKWEKKCAGSRSIIFFQVTFNNKLIIDT